MAHPPTLPAAPDVGGGQHNDRVPDVDPLASFQDATRAWFTEAFEAPTAAQAGAWAAIEAGDHALVVAPTGSGKTLSAFLWSLDRLLHAEPVAPERRCRILYVSPLKALAADVERNLRSPLVGIARTAARLGRTAPDVRVGVRTGDTPAAERRRLAGTPPDILITTPESLFLVLTSAARAGLAGVETVILDEVHVMAGSKRGAHLAVSLERLDAMLARPAQRIGLSATVRPVETVMGFLAGTRAIADGGRPVTLVQPPATKQLQIEVRVPVPDLTDLAPPLAVPAPARTRATDPVDDNPVDDNPELGPGRSGEPDLSGDASGAVPGAERTPSIWPHVTRELTDLIAAHRTTLVFTNSRRTAERLTARLNEEWERRLAERDGETVPPRGAPGEVWPAQAQAQSGASLGAPGVIARAHHGSMSREARTQVEDDLKAGRLPAVVATSSLELGIDMGTIDVVVQIGSPPSVAGALQRIGRAGHQVGAVSRGVVVPTHRGDLLPAVVTTQRAREGRIEQVHPPANPLDVLAQQIVAMLAVEDWTVADLAALLRRASPFATLGEASLVSVLDMLAGRYPSEDFASLRARIVWDREAGTLSGRPGALRLAATSGGTIPDRGLFGVYLVGEDGVADQVAARGGRRVGELDEEMVFESRVGDTFTLGTSTWRIEQITPDRVLVSPAPGMPGRLPFWKGDQPGRPAELGVALGSLVREITTAHGTDARALTRTFASLDLPDWTRDNLAAYLAEQAAATGYLPTDATLVVERFRDDIGDWRLVLHSPYGSRVHAPWALVIADRLRERLGTDVGVMHADDGIVLRVPDMTGDPMAIWDPPTAPAPPAPGAPESSAPAGSAAPGATGLADLGGFPEHDGERPSRADGGVSLADLLIEPDDVRRSVVDAVGSSAHFAARFREAAARSLLLPRRRPDGRQPLWQQRQRASQLLAVAARYPDFPVVLEAVRECLQDDFDTAALSDLMRRIGTREVRIVEVTTASPSPFARSLLFSYVGTFLYDGDAPLAERRAAALTLDPELLAELLGEGMSDLADLLDPAAVLAVEDEVGLRTERYAARDAERLVDVLARLGPLDLAGLQNRAAEPDAVADWLTELEAARRVLRVRVAGREQWAVVEDAARLRDALGVALPVGLPEAFLARVPDPLGDLVRRHARSHGPFEVADLAARFGLAPGTLTPTLTLLERAGTLVTGRLRPVGAVRTRPAADVGTAGAGDAETAESTTSSSPTASAPDAPALDATVPDGAFTDDARSGALEYCDADILRRMRRRSLAAARADVEAVPARALGVFAPRWHQLGQLRGADGLLTAIDQLAGARLDVADLETSILPARVVDYTPALLDELTSAGEVVWVGAGRSASGGSVVLLPADAVSTLAPEPLEPAHRLTPAVLEALADGGRFFRDVVAAVRGAAEADGEDAPSPADVEEALWDAAWSGLVTNDTIGALRARGAPSGTGSRPSARPRRPSRRALLSPALGASQARVATPPTAAGRWSLVEPRHPDPTVRRAALVASMLERHGVLLRGVASAEDVSGGFAALYPVLARLEETGAVRRGYLVEGQGAAQFALPECVDRLRADAQLTPGAVVIAATDPANPYGALLPWPAAVGEESAGRPRRVAGADVVLVDGELALFLERGGGSVVGLTADGDTLGRAAGALAEAAPTRYAGLTLRRVDGENALSSTSATRTALVEAGFVPTPRGLRLRAPGPRTPSPRTFRARG